MEEMYLVYKYWELSTTDDSDEKIVLFLSQPISDANDEISLLKNHHSRRLIGWTMFFTSEKWSYGKPRHPWRENWQATFLFSRCQKGLWTSVLVDNFIAEQENKATLEKTQRDVKLLQTFLATRMNLEKLKKFQHWS